jgi:hypothetical protein
MAFLVQNEIGTVAGANAYVTVEFVNEYHKDRGNDAWGVALGKQALIIRASDHLDERFKYVGERLQVRQSTEWPRQNAYDIDDDYVEGIPQEVKEAVAEYALLAATLGDLNPTPTRDATGQTVIASSETVGPISSSVKYAGGGAFQLPKYPRADRKLVARGLVEKGGRLIRG